MHAPDPYTAANVALRMLHPIGAPRIQVCDLDLLDAPDDHAFRATVLFDDRSFVVSNRGDGAENRYQGNENAIAAARGFANALLAEPDALDAIVRDHIEKAELRSMLERSAQSGICFVLPADSAEEQDGFRCVPGTGAAARAYVAERYPGAIVLNDILSDAA